MSGNDFADFFPLEPTITTNEPSFPEVFKSDGKHKTSNEFTNLIPEVYSNVPGTGYRTATDFNILTPATFKYKLVTTTVTTTATKYRMRGYFIGGSTYEFWITTDPNSANPSGNPLVGKMIDSIIAAS